MHLHGDMFLPLSMWGFPNSTNFKYLFCWMLK